MGLNFEPVSGVPLSSTINYYFSLLDDNKIKMARKPGKKPKENPVGCTGEGKR